MVDIAIIKSGTNLWAEMLGSALHARSRNRYYFVSPEDFRKQVAQDSTRPHALFIPSFIDRDGVIPDLHKTEAALHELAHLKSGVLALISSALIYGVGPARQPFAKEDYLPPKNGQRGICDHWVALENIVKDFLNDRMHLIVLRPVTVISSPTALGRLFARKFVSTLPGHDPVLQLLTVDDLAEAIDLAFQQNRPGTFNVAPADVVPLHAAIRMAGKYRVVVPRSLQRLVRNSALLDHLRYSWTVCNEKAKKDLGFVPAKSTRAALPVRQSSSCHNETPDSHYDDFGMDKDYIRFYGKTLFHFLSDYYWRIEMKGLEHIPQQGRAVLVGIHRGFMPWDGVMALHLLVRETGRYPRFLTHPGLLKFPFLANFMTKLGGVVASQQSADRVLQGDNLLGIFPEGIHGAFTMYRNAYELQEFGRDAYVKIALRNRAPIIPFVTVGSAEIFPILGKIKSRLVTRYADWPYIPLTPTFPFLPLPLPSKWHTCFLPPIHIEREHPPEAARSKAIAKAISLDVRAKMQEALREMLERRRSIFFGSIFESKNI